jgi:aminoglycoside phosphotransferase (APT) family kinase protein
MERDPDDLAAGIAAWLATARRVAEVEVTRCERASGGLSSETLFVDASGVQDGSPWRESLVLRLAPLGPGIFPEYDLARQAVAQEVAAAHGVPTAIPAEVERDARWLGAPFMVMPAIAGHVPGAAAMVDPWVADAAEADQARMFTAVLDVLAAVHAIPVSAVGRAVAARDLDAELGYWREYLAWYGGGEELVPALSAALAWCAAHRPAVEPPPALLWGDVRLGNVIFDDARAPVAVLDWEMTMVGAPEHDVAWFLALEAVQAELFGSAVPGFPDHDAAVAYYERAAGRSLVALAWFEVLALVRSIAVMTRLGFLEQQGGGRARPLSDNPLLGILERRIAAASRAS